MIGRKGNVVKQVVKSLDTPLGPGDPGEIAWVQAQRSAFAKYLAKEWERGPDLDRIYVVALWDVNRDAREKSRARRATPEGRERAREATRRSRSTAEGRARANEASRRYQARKRAEAQG